MAKQAQPSNQQKAEEKAANRRRVREAREKAMDQTLADSYPASDPPSTIPDPEGELPEEQNPKGRDEAPEGQQSPVSRKDKGKDKAA